MDMEKVTKITIYLKHLGIYFILYFNINCIPILCDS